MRDLAQIVVTPGEELFLVPSMTVYRFTIRYACELESKFGEAYFMAEMDALAMLLQIETAMRGLAVIANKEEPWSGDERAVLCRSISGLTRVVTALVERHDWGLKLKSSAMLKSVSMPPPE
jgi:hypothetical protein